MTQYQLEPSSVVRASKDQVSCDLEGQKAILDAKRGMYYGLEDSVGCRVWDLIKTPRRIEALVQILSEEWDVAPSRCEQDLLLFLSELLKNGLIEIQP